jgi:hypothetical protein
MVGGSARLVRSTGRAAQVSNRRLWRLICGNAAPRPLSSREPGGQGAMCLWMEAVLMGLGVSVP